MVIRTDIIKDTYLRLTTARLGYAAGLIGHVHTLGTDWAGQWYFQLRWLNRPVSKRNKPLSEWSLNFREKDLEDFERIDTWDQVQELVRESRPLRKSKQRALRLPGHWRWKRHPNQIRLFEEF